jgi:hypothetical protein
MSSRRDTTRERRHRPILGFHPKRRARRRPHLHHATNGEPHNVSSKGVSSRRTRHESAVTARFEDLRLSPEAQRRAKITTMAPSRRERRPQMLTPRPKGGRGFQHRERGTAEMAPAPLSQHTTRRVPGHPHDHGSGQLLSYWLACTPERSHLPGSLPRSPSSTHRQTEPKTKSHHHHRPTEPRPRGKRPLQPLCPCHPAHQPEIDVLQPPWL